MWETSNTARELEALIGLAVLTENDTNSVALGTFWSGGANAIVVEADGIGCWCGSRGCLDTVGPPRE